VHFFRFQNLLVALGLNALGCSHNGSQR